PIVTCGPSSTPEPSSTSWPSVSPTARSGGAYTRGLAGGRSAVGGRSVAGCCAPRPLKLRLQPLEHPDDAQPALAARPRLGARPHALEEVLALDPQRLDVGDRRRADLARAGDVLPPVAYVLIEALVVDRDLALERHVVEGRHALGADDGEAALLVGIEPRQVQVRGQARGEAQEAE